VDKIYGFKAYNAGEGWTAAQAAVNVVETMAYIAYLYVVYKHGEQEPRQGAGAPDRSTLGQFRALAESRTVTGHCAGMAVITAYTAATVTFWKTIIYWLIEGFSGSYIDPQLLLRLTIVGWENIGHNSWSTLLFFWGPMK
jgi:hypothetical protein